MDMAVTMAVTNRQHKSSNPRDPSPVTIISSSTNSNNSYTPGKRSKRKRTTLLKRVVSSEGTTNYLVLFASLVLLLGTSIFIYNTVDWTFLGGVFMIGLQDNNNVDGRYKQYEEKKDNHNRNDRNNDDRDVRPFPKDWQTYTYSDIRHHFNCRMRSKDMDKPLPTLEDWNLMRETYTRVVDGNEEWDDPIPPTLGYSLRPGEPIPPPYYAKFSKGKGRGLFASRDIEEGELVHDGTVSDVIFPSGMAWREYVFSLQRNFACDTTDWHWMQKLEEGGEYYMLGGINISSFMNSGGKEFGPGRMPNALPKSSTSGKFYATRDIEEGEEILTDYDTYYTNWSEVGL